MVDDIEVFVHDSIHLKENAEIIQSVKLPFMKPLLGVKGVTY